MGAPTLALALCFTLQSVMAWVVQPPVLTTPSLNPDVLCSKIKFLDPKRTSATRESVLRQLCKVGLSHVTFYGNRKQFAIFNLHQDGSENMPRWHSGDAQDVLGDRYWEVNDMVQLEFGKYYWYRHGIPMWPLPHQAVANMTTKISYRSLPYPKKKKNRRRKNNFNKIADWPNYGMATPIYYFARAMKYQAWSIDQFFRETEKSSNFKDHDAFERLIISLLDATAGQKLENYNGWPFLKYSLKLMVKAMIKRTKGVCPAELYIYFRVIPCRPKDAKYFACGQAEQEARKLLAETKCRDTDVIVGYTKEYNWNAI